MNAINQADLSNRRPQKGPLMIGPVVVGEISEPYKAPSLETDEDAEINKTLRGAYVFIFGSKNDKAPKPYPPGTYDEVFS